MIFKKQVADHQSLKNNAGFPNWIMDSGCNNGIHFNVNKNRLV